MPFSPFLVVFTMRMDIQSNSNASGFEGFIRFF